MAGEPDFKPKIPTSSDEQLLAELYAALPALEAEDVDLLFDLLDDLRDGWHDEAAVRSDCASVAKVLARTVAFRGGGDREQIRGEVHRVLVAHLLPGDDAEPRELRIDRVRARQIAVGLLEADEVRTRRVVGVNLTRAAWLGGASATIVLAGIVATLAITSGFGGDSGATASQATEKIEPVHDRRITMRGDPGWTEICWVEYGDLIEFSDPSELTGPAEVRIGHILRVIDGPVAFESFGSGTLHLHKREEGEVAYRVRVTPHHPTPNRRVNVDPHLP